LGDFDAITGFESDVERWITAYFFDVDNHHLRTAEQADFALVSERGEPRPQR
jgi:hypothetical protein